VLGLRGRRGLARMARSARALRTGVWNEPSAVAVERDRRTRSRAHRSAWGFAAQSGLLAKLSSSMLARAISSGVSLASSIEVLMARNMPVPEIPPGPSPRPGRAAKAAGVSRSGTAQAAQSREPELPDLLEAFWGDEAATSAALGSRRVKRLDPDNQDAGTSGAP
jgi:hypothetical protein